MGSLTAPVQMQLAFVHLYRREFTPTVRPVPELAAEVSTGLHYLVIEILANTARAGDVDDVLRDIRITLDELMSHSPDTETLEAIAALEFVQRSIAGDNSLWVGNSSVPIAHINGLTTLAQIVLDFGRQGYESSRLEYAFGIQEWSLQSFRSSRG